MPEALIADLQFFHPQWAIEPPPISLANATADDKKWLGLAFLERSTNPAPNAAYPLTEIGPYVVAQEYRLYNIYGVRATIDANGHFAEPAAPPPVLAADFTSDGRVDVDDLLILLSNWSEGHGCDGVKPCIGDLNHDEMVGVDDLLILLNNWTS